MAKLSKAVGKVVANASMTVATSSANSVCFCWLHQPVLPEAVKNLRKF